MIPYNCTRFVCTLVDHAVKYYYEKSPEHQFLKKGNVSKIIEMELIKCLLIPFFLVNPTLADFKSCSQEHDQTSMCFLGEEGYVNPNHLNNLELDTMLYVKEIIDIDGNQNDIRLQLELWSYWTDPGLALTNESV